MTCPDSRGFSRQAVLGVGRDGVRHLDQSARLSQLLTTAHASCDVPYYSPTSRPCSLCVDWALQSDDMPNSRLFRYLQYTKCGCPPAQAGSCEDVVSYDEAWLFASADIAAATGSVQPTFATLPAGDVGLLAHNRTQPGVGPGVGSEVVGAGVGSEGPDPSCKLAQLAGCYTQTGCTAAAQNASASDACFAATVNPDWGTCVTVSCTSPGGGAWRCPQNTTGCSGGTTGYSRDAAMTATAPPNNVMPTPTGAGSWIAEEGNLVEMGNHTPARLYYAYRTSDGYLGVGTSVDGGLTFNAPMYGGYSRSVPGEANRLKNPRGPITPRRVFGNRYDLTWA